MYTYLSWHTQLLRTPHSEYCAPWKRGYHPHTLARYPGIVNQQTLLYKTVNWQIQLLRTPNSKYWAPYKRGHHPPTLTRYSVIVNQRTLYSGKLFDSTITYSLVQLLSSEHPRSRATPITMLPWYSNPVNLKITYLYIIHSPLIVLSTLQAELYHPIRVLW